MARFQERFVDQKGYFYPGENIVGYVTVNLPEELEFRKLTLKFKGKSCCHWEQGTRESRTSYTNREVYFNEKIVLLRPSSPSVDMMKLPAGEYSYPFNFKLPEHLPPSFELPCGFRGVFSASGFVRYSMKIAFDVDTYILKSHVEEKLLPRFKVAARPSDLTQIGPLLEPAECTKEKYICCLCCRSGPIQLVCQLTKRAFEPGENIIFNLELHNQSTDNRLGKVTAELVQEIILFNEPSWVSMKTQDNRTVETLVLADHVDAHGEELWKNAQLMVPTEAVPSFENCQCIHVTYTFMARVEVPGGLDMVLKFPISIINTVKCSQPVGGIPLVDHPVYPPPPIIMQPGASTDIPSQPPPPYQG